MKENIKILVIDKTKINELTIKNRIDEIYGLVYYPYGEIPLFDNVYVIYSKEATENKDKIFYRNTKINGIEIYGTFIIVAKNKKGFVSLSDQQVEEIKNIFGGKD